MLKKKLKVWQWRLFSFSGRLKLFKSVIFSDQYYWSVEFQLQIKTMLKTEQMMASFLWKEDTHAINWNKICKPKTKGNLGLKL